MESPVEEVGGRMQTCRHLRVVCEPPFEGFLGPLLGEFLVVLKRLIEALAVNGEAEFLGDLFGHLDRETIGIVEFERDPPRDGPGRVLQQIRNHLLELVLPLLQGIEESLLLPGEFRKDHLPIPDEFRIGLRVEIDHDFRRTREERFIDSQLPPMPARAPDEASEDVALPQVGGFDPEIVSQDEYRRLQMVRDDTDRDIRLRRRAVCPAGTFLDCRHDGSEELDLID
jgi:hypothetical protein